VTSPHPTPASISTTRRRLPRSRSGFTLLEIMLVVTIIALLLGAGIYYMTGSAEYAREVRIRGDFQTMTTQLRLYQSMNGFLPSSQQGLGAMVNRPESEPRPRQWRQLLKQVPLDPWQSEYGYVQPGRKSKEGFDLFSKGPDRVADTPDDIGNWSEETQ
jgi:general secretion pathway protein G